MNSAEIKDEFRRNPYPVFIDILRKANQPLTGAEIMDAVAEHGVPRAKVKEEWDRFRPEAKEHHPEFVKVGAKWAYSARSVSTAEALDSLLAVSPPSRSKIKKWLREEIVKDLRPRLETTPGTGEGGGDGPDDEGLLRVSRERQFQIDRLVAIAEIAGEVEELAYTSGDPDAIVDKVQTKVLAADLSQVGRAGHDEPFDPTRHEAVGARPSEGAAVTVIRPGYTWLEGGKVTVLRKALVTEA